MNRLKKKLNIGYARYVKRKRSDRYVEAHELSKAEKHSKRVTKLKGFSLRMVILLILLIIIWPLANKDWSGKKIKFQNEGQNEGKEAEVPQKKEEKKSDLPVMLKPNFLGNDNNSKPFTIVADSGVSMSDDKVILSNISSDMELKDDSKINLKSVRGDYADKEKRLILNEGVVITTQTNYKITTNSALVKLDENTATGSEKVNVVGPMGDTEAHGFEITNDGDNIVLTGGINLNTIINNQTSSAFQTGNENAVKDKPANKKTPAKKQSSQDDQADKPINIISDVLVIKDKENLAIFQKNVHVTQGDMNLRCDELKVHTERDDDTGKNRFSLMEAEGNVDFKSTNKSATSDHGTYNVPTGDLILTDNVHLKDASDDMEGKTFVYNSISGKSQIIASNPTVNKNSVSDIPSSSIPGMRVRATFTPGEDSDDLKLQTTPATTPAKTAPKVPQNKNTK